MGPRSAAMPVIALALAKAATAAGDRYVDAVRRAGGTPLVVRPGDSPPSTFDALCLTGGGDIAPERYGAGFEAHVTGVDKDRDDLDFLLLDRALGANVPLLAICRGFQVLNVGLGGRLIPHVEGHAAAHGPIVQHQVTAVTGSLLATLIGTAPCSMNSRHHQAVSEQTLAPSLTKTAVVGGLVEAAELQMHRWVVGVQWHPERVADRDLDVHAHGVFAALVEAASHPR